MYSLTGSRLSFPLHSTNLFISAFNALIVFGLCDVKGSYIHYFEFHYSELCCLYAAFVEWLKHYSDENNENATNEETILLIKTSRTYLWKKKVDKETKIIKLIAKHEALISLEIILNYNHFNNFIQALYFLTWQCLSLSELHLSILTPLMSISFSDLYELRKPENVLIYLKASNKKTTSYSSIILFHIRILLFLHKIGRLINYELLDESLKVLNVS